MRLSRPLKRRPPETIVALVDVVFFLLVFALLIGRMDATAPFNVTPPQAQTGTDMPDTRLRINADGATALLHVLPLVERLKQAGATDIVLVVTPDAGG